MTKIIKLCPSNSRGSFDFGWLKSKHTFSFGQYYNPDFMEFSHLRVINEDVVQGNTGFDLHGHKNMEIFTYILSGTLTHGDNLGNKENIDEGCYQLMSAGTGILHSEYNYTDKPVHLLQIWIKPNVMASKPEYKTFAPHKKGEWCLLASDKIKDKNIGKIKQDAEIYAIHSLDLSEIKLPYQIRENSWLHIAQGKIEFLGEEFSSGDAVGFSLDGIEKIKFKEASILLLFAL
jgi:redox-sensitive bicupin YhaK (pirin superfamily)